MNDSNVNERMLTIKSEYLNIRTAVRLPVAACGFDDGNHPTSFNGMNESLDHTVVPHCNLSASSEFA
jgi:hypothetical protein